jgi:hypothetical protein
MFWTRKEKKICSWLDYSCLHFSENLLVAAKNNVHICNDRLFSNFRSSSNFQSRFQSGDWFLPRNFLIKLSAQIWPLIFFEEINKDGQDRRCTTVLQNNGSAVGRIKCSARLRPLWAIVTNSGWLNNLQIKVTDDEFGNNGKSKLRVRETAESVSRITGTCCSQNMFCCAFFKTCTTSSTGCNYSVIQRIVARDASFVTGYRFPAFIRYCSRFAVCQIAYFDWTT